MSMNETNKRIFLDNGAGSFPKAPDLDQALIEALNFGTGNINRSSYNETATAGLFVLEAREALCDLFNFKNSSHVIFTSGVTASLNYIIKGFLKKGDRVLISPFEHNAVLRPLVQLEKQIGIGIDIIPAIKDNPAFLDLRKIEELISSKTKLAIISHASNVSGFIQPIDEVSKILNKYDLPLVIDGAQTAGHISIDLEQIKPAAFCFTGHKGLLGPQGSGGILFDEDFAKQVEPLITGGTGSASDSLITPSFMPDKFEAGTQNLIGIAGLKHSVEWLLNFGVENIHKHEKKLLEIFINGLDSDKIKVLGSTAIKNRVGIISLDCSEAMDNAKFASLLEEDYGILTRTGLHCSPLAHKTFDSFPQGAVRFSTSPFTTEEEIEYTVSAINSILSLS